MTSFDNINTLKVVADVVNRLSPKSDCVAFVRADDKKATLKLQHGEVYAEMCWDSPLYHYGITRLLEILAENGYQPTITLRQDALCHCLLDLTINGKTVNSGDCTIGVAVMGAFFAIAQIEGAEVPA